MRFNREQFVSDALALTKLNIPWRHQGRDPLTGLDCIGMPRFLYRSQGLELPEELDREFRSYHHKPDGKKLLRVMREFFTEITRDELQPADLIVAFIYSNPQHMAVVVSPDSVVEAFRSSDGYVCRVLERKLKATRHIAACFRIPDEAN